MCASIAAKTLFAPISRKTTMIRDQNITIFRESSEKFNAFSLSSNQKPEFLDMKTNTEDNIAEIAFLWAFAITANEFSEPARALLSNPMSQRKRSKTLKEQSTNKLLWFYSSSKTPQFGCKSRIAIYFFHFFLSQHGAGHRRGRSRRRRKSAGLFGRRTWDTKKALPLLLSVPRKNHSCSPQPSLLRVSTCVQEWL